MSDKALDQTYFDVISTAIDEEGVYPHQAVCKSRDGELQINALAVDVKTWARIFWEKIGEFEEVIFGLDMTTRPNQGTRYADALVFVHWIRDGGRELVDSRNFRVGVINYQHEPRIVDEIDWNNDHWDYWMRSVLQQYRPPLLVRVEHG